MIPGYALLSALLVACGGGAATEASSGEGDGSLPEASPLQVGERLSFLDVPSEDGSATLSFTDLHFEAIGATRAVLGFRTSRPTTCEAEYGLTPSLGSTAEDPSMDDGALALDHRVVFEDLEPETLYYVRARAVDAEQRVYLSGMLELRTARDREAPVAENVALATAGTRVMDVSSNFGGGAVDGPWGASHAIDGSMRTEWATDGDGDDAWLELDLGMARQLDRFGYRSRDMQDGTAIVTSVRLIVEGTEVYGPFDAPDPAVRYLFELAPPATGRFIRFEAVHTTGGNTGARQIELYGR